MKKLMCFLTLLSLSACKSELTDLPYQNLPFENQLNLSFLKGKSLQEANVVVNPFGISPLTALISFDLDYESEVTLIVHGKDELTTLSNTFEKGKSFNLPVLGLYMGENLVTVKTNQEEKSFKIVTEFIDIPKAEVTTKNPKYLDNSFYFLSPSGDKPIAFDVNGDVRWYLDLDSTWEIKENSEGYLLLSTERLVNPMYYTSGFYLMDYLGKIYYEYSLDGGYHHDAFEMENGNYLVCSNDFSRGTVEDVIVEINSKGEILRTINLLDILDPSEAKAISSTDDDWFHNNAVYYDKYNNLILLSGRHVDSIIALDYDTLEIVYILGDPSTYVTNKDKVLTSLSDNEKYFYHQHAIKVIDENHIMLFDNGNYRSKNKDTAIPIEDSFSRMVIYEIDLENRTFKETYSYGEERGNTYYSPYISEADYLGENHYLVHSGGVVLKNGITTNLPSGLSSYDELRSYTTELINDEVVFELLVNENYYRAEKINIYEGLKTDLEQVINRYGQFNKTETINKKYSKTFEIDDEYISHNIKIYQELDRLVFRGEFSSKDKVTIYLKGEEINAYEWRISKKPYTSLCVSTFENAILEKYINTIDLNGTYEILLEINEKCYKTNYKVEINND